MNEWALPTIALLLLGYGAVSARLQTTLALVLFTDAVGVNPGRLRRESLVPARLLGVGLPLTIVAGTLGGLAAPGASADAGRGDLDGGVVGVRPRPHRLSRRQRYADWYAAHARDHAAMPESAPVAEQHLRDRTLTNRERT